MDREQMEQMKKTYRGANQRKLIVILLLIPLIVVATLYSFHVTQYSISFSESIDYILHHDLVYDGTNYRIWLKQNIVWESLVPRGLECVFIGALLAIGGAIMQTLMKNPLADPYTTGISSGALLGVTIYVCLDISVLPFAPDEYAMIANAFVLALVPSMAILAFSIKGRVTPTFMILIGIAVMYIFNAISTMLRYVASDEDVAGIYAWTVGNMGKASWDNVPYVFAVLLVAFVLSMAMSGALNVMSSNDTVAQTEGVNPKRMRLAGYLVVSLATAAAVSFVGTIGFVGLMAPHIARSFVGSNMRYLIPSSAVIGALILLICDAIGRVITATGMPVGVITSIVGGPLFILILLRQRRMIWTRAVINEHFLSERMNRRMHPTDWIRRPITVSCWLVFL